MKSMRQYHQQGPAGSDMAADEVRVSQDYQLGLYWLPERQQHASDLLPSAAPPRLSTPDFNADTGRSNTATARVAISQGPPMPIAPTRSWKLHTVFFINNLLIIPRRHSHAARPFLPTCPGGPAPSLELTHPPTPCHIPHVVSDTRSFPLCGSKPREVELRIWCEPNEPSHIDAIEEVSTCRYVVQACLKS